MLIWGIFVAMLLTNAQMHQCVQSFFFVHLDFFSDSIYLLSSNRNDQNVSLFHKNVTHEHAHFWPIIFRGLRCIIYRFYKCAYTSTRWRSYIFCNWIINEFFLYLGMKSIASVKKARTQSTKCIQIILGSDIKWSLIQIECLNIEYWNIVRNENVQMYTL